MKLVGLQQVYMAVSGWDGNLSVYTVNAGGPGISPDVNPYGQSVKFEGPILGICWEADVQDPMTGGTPSLMIYVAHSDGNIYSWDARCSQNPPRSVSKHQAPCKDVCSFSCNNQVFLVSGGWDSYVKFFQIQSSGLQ